jgi:LysM repeat protein
MLKQADSVQMRFGTQRLNLRINDKIKIKMKKAICFWVLVSALSFSYAGVQDSVGIKKHKDVLCIVHKVEQGEGVYGIGRRYGVNPSEIFALNPGSEKGLKLHELIYVPVPGKETAAVDTKTKAEPAEKKPVYHTVSKGETIHSLSRAYNTTVDELKRLNGLSDENIQLGQKLIVSHSLDQGASTETETADVPTKAGKDSNQPVAATSSTYPSASNTSVVIMGDEVNETGVASISAEGEMESERNFVQHPTASVGTIVMITNPSNKKAVFARVVAKCSLCKESAIRVSPTVAQKLNLADGEKVTISYAK